MHIYEHHAQKKYNFIINYSYYTNYLSFKSLTCFHHSEVQPPPQRTVHNVQFWISTKCKEMNSRCILKQRCVSSQSKQMGSSISVPLLEVASFNSPPFILCSFPLSPTSSSGLFFHYQINLACYNISLCCSENSSSCK